MAVLTQAQTLIRRPQTRQRALSSVWVTAREAFWIALETLRTHKLRSFLTLLGVVISTTTLIVVMSIINGMNKYIADRIANLGANVFVVSQYSWTNNDEEWLRERRRNKPIRVDDYEFLKENLHGYKSIGAAAWLWPRPTVKYNGHSLYDLNVTGQTPSMVGMQQEQVEFGRYFTESEYDHAAQVCFIGQDITDEFFPTVDPIDKVIDVGGQPFRVVGVAKRIGKTLGQSQDDFVQMPLTAFAKLFMARPRMNVMIQAWSGPQMVELQDEARAVMRARHHLPFKETDDFGINASETIMGMWQDLTGKLFGGGIGIMNIMLASVTERTHEIGIRKSLGARRRDILVQFVIESAVMAGAGGVTGILLAAGIAKLVDIVFTASVPANAIVVGLVLSTSVGLFFGIYPASKAAKLDPIEALRTEN